MPIHILPFGHNITTFCAETVVSDLAERLPDLSDAVILVPEATARIKAQFIALRKYLSDSARRRGYEALIPPTITTPYRLFATRHLMPNEETKSLYAKLSLATALHQYKDIFPHANRWQLTDEIISIFNRISEYEYAEQSDFSLEKSAEMLDSTWQDDTRVLLTLWQTWKSLYNEANYPMFTWYKTLAADTYTEPHEHVYLCGINRLSPCLGEWARNLYKKDRLTWMVKANTCSVPTACHPVRETFAQLATDTADAVAFPSSDNDYSRLLDQIFCAEGSSNQENVPFAKRARQFAEQVGTSPCRERIRLFFPTTTEEHAWGIYIAVRRWLEHKHRRIALVSLDRRLSRRIRAIFEKRNIPLIDYSGWELSTTSSAAAFRHLLIDADNALNIKTVLALMRSPYCDLGIEHRDAIEAANHIEYLLGRYQIQHSSITKTIHKLKAIASSNPLSVSLVEKIAEALNPIVQLKDEREHLYAVYFENLFKTMKKLGMYEKLSMDKAGERLISELQQIYKAVKKEKEKARFNLWHNLILHRLEKSNFMPDLPDHGVFLMNPEQAELMQFDALAIVALDYRHLPHQPQSGLINENIHRELALDTYEQFVGKQFFLFRTLLESAEHLLLSCQQYIQNRKLMPSAWLTALHHFHKIAYCDLTDHELQNTARLCSALDLSDEQGLKPQIQSIAEPTAAKHLWPQALSVNAYQNIIDCPYRFYARYLLKIQSPLKVSDYWEAINYGSYLHRCLQKLHTHLDDSYEQPIWQMEKRAAILDVARQILHAQFKKSASDNYANYFWLNDAQEAMTYYIDWMIEQQQEQAISSTQTEIKLEKELGENLSMMGFADLILHTENGAVLIDYKTGFLATEKDIRNGEHIQLLSYALLDENVKTAIYLGLGAKNIGSQRTLSEDKLAEYHDKNLRRLLNIKADYNAEQPLKAWGNKKNICKHCSYAGLCRRAAWDEYHDWAGYHNPAE